MTRPQQELPALPVELMYKIFEYTESKHNMLKAFPCLYNLIPKCQVCKESKSCYYIERERNDLCHDCLEYSKYIISTIDELYMCSLTCKDIYCNKEKFNDRPCKRNNYTVRGNIGICNRICIDCGEKFQTDVELTICRFKSSTCITKRIQEVIWTYLLTSYGNTRNYVRLSSLVRLYKCHFDITKMTKAKEKVLKNEFRKALGLRPNSIKAKGYSLCDYDTFRTLQQV